MTSWAGSTRLTGDDDSDFSSALSGARSGHGWAFTWLYESLNRQIAGFVRARGVDDVDDLVNDVFLAAFKGLDGFSGDRLGFRSWMFRITRNKVSDHFRLLSRQQHSILAAELDLSTRMTDDGAHSQVLDGLVVDNLLRTLTDPQRDVILLRVVAGLTAPQTAEVLHKPLSAIKALQRRALRRLQEEISPSVVSI